MKDVILRVFGHELTYRDLIQVLVALILWNLAMIWHDRYQAFKPMIEMAVNQNLIP
ncbi:hypothetical protein [Tellurirhabdus rosea]|uniref:hypothetical protein n=1 Tax=Tellurirhabdus rosea TaxID=2674997 RepID=UPI00225C0FE2|nr:hypothetical protein [Tellurirhabdus rosea]